MQNYKEVCGKNERVWFEISKGEGEKFLQWAKDLGCVWVGGKEIEPEKGTGAYHFSIRNDGTLAYVSMMVWFAEESAVGGVERYMFGEYLKGNKVRPKSRIVRISEVL